MQQLFREARKIILGEGTLETGFRLERESPFSNVVNLRRLQFREQRSGLTQEGFVISRESRASIDRIGFENLGQIVFKRECVARSIANEAQARLGQGD